MEKTFRAFTLQETAGAARAALWAALMAAGAYVSLPLGPVPITLQTFFILLCGFTEGFRAWKPAALYVGAGLLGFPVFAGGVAGPAILAGPTAGFALSFPLAAAAAGIAAGRGWPARALCGALATAVVNAAGAVGLHANLSLPWDRAFLAVTPFLPGDALKAAAAAACAAGIAGRLGIRDAAPEIESAPPAGEAVPGVPVFGLGRTGGQEPDLGAEDGKGAVAGPEGVKDGPESAGTGPSAAPDAPGQADVGPDAVAVAPEDPSGPGERP
ncbi:MAG: biotin transporter BioY [Deltaproteobacteria bacterium]|jgi:biotin transport system substrate-specific component|nr:biotin transporter BioY [Deltaproteobacteria bacterium]